MKSLIFLLLLLLLNSCYTINNDTRFKIESFRVLNYNTTEGIIKIKFDVKYYPSDKDTGYLSLEKGLKGSDDKVLFLGIISDSIPINKKCKHVNYQDSIDGYYILNFQEFIDGFNNKDRRFIGQRFDTPYKFCVPPQYIKANSEISLVLEHQDRKKIDTLKSSIW